MNAMKIMKAAALGLAVLALAGCAHARVTGLNRTGSSTGAPPPEQVLVQVTATPQATSPEAQQVSGAASGMQTALLQTLAAARVPAAIYNPALDQPGVLVLHASISSASPGNAAARLAVGLGAGAAQVSMSVTVRPGGQAAGSTEAFALSSQNGAKPGLILPAGIALATHNVWHLAIGGAIDVAMNRRTGMTPAEENAAKQVVAQLQSYYAAQGWNWPAQNP